MMPHRQQILRAFTLVEMVMSMAILVIIMLSVASVARMAARTSTFANANDGTAPALSVRDALDRINMDLKVATAITSRSATSISLVVPDRNGDGDPETITYSWSGTAGDPLKRYYDSSMSYDTLLSSVTSLNFNYLDKTVTSPLPVESAEQLLMSYTGTPNATTNLTTASWECQYVNPASVLPANAISWKITRVQFLLKRKSGASGNVIVRVRAADAVQKPTGASLASCTVAVSTISATANTWVDMPLDTAVAGIAPGTGMTLVISSSTATFNCTINGMVFTGPATTTGMKECYTINTGGTWTLPSDAAVMDVKVYGTVTTPAP